MLGLVRQLERTVIAFSNAPNIRDLCNKYRFEETIDTSYRSKL